MNQLLRKVPVWAVYLLGVLPAPWLVYLGATGGLGVEPINALERELGEIALQLLVVGLAITPLRKIAGLNLLKFRRAIGLLSFIYVLLHLTVWIVLDVQLLSQIWADILKRPYITVGMASFVLMIPLALTSNNWSVKKLGRGWRSLHKVTYVVGVLGGLHFLMLVKGWQLEPMAYFATICVLLSFRFKSHAIRHIWTAVATQSGRIRSKG